MEKKRKIVPPVYFLTALTMMIVMHFFAPLAFYAQSLLLYAGVLLASFGLGMVAMSARIFKQVDTGIVRFDEATVLVSGGFYRFTRNPMYLGMVLVLLGIALAMGTAGSLVPIPFFIWVIHGNFILGEERFLEEAFGEEYLAFKSKVRRWL